MPQKISFSDLARKNNRRLKVLLELVDVLATRKTVDRLSKSLGLSRATIYRYFDHLEHLGVPLLRTPTNGNMFYQCNAPAVLQKALARVLLEHFDPRLARLLDDSVRSAHNPGHEVPLGLRNMYHHLR